MRKVMDQGAVHTLHGGLKDTGETWHLGATFGTVQDHFTEDIIGTIDET